MGGNVSKAEAKINTKVLNESTFNFVSKTMTSTSQSADVKQTIKLNGLTIHCAPEIKNDASVSLKTLQKVTEQQSISLIDNIVNELKSQADTKNTQENGFLSTAIANTAQSKVDIESQVETKIRKSITMETINDIVQTLNTKQAVDISGTTIDPCGLDLYYKYVKQAPTADLLDCAKTAPCNIGNNMLVALAAEQIVSKVVDVIQNMKLENKTDSSGSADNSQKNSGFSLGMLLAGVVGLIVFMIIVFLIIRMLKGGGGGGVKIVQVPVAAAPPA